MTSFSSIRHGSCYTALPYGSVGDSKRSVPMPRTTIGCTLALAFALAGSSAATAESIAVRYTEGITRGFPVLRSIAGDKLAQGELSQVPRGDVVESRLVFR